jgi:hypothetical protein
MAQLDETAARCNYTGYMEKFVTYPPTGLLPLPGKSTFAAPGCDVWDTIFDAALLVNPAFNIYRIFDTFPVLWDVLGFPCVLSICCICRSDAHNFYLVALSHKNRHPCISTGRMSKRPSMHLSTSTGRNARILMFSFTIAT